jgi:hypothetical protein
MPLQSMIEHVIESQSAFSKERASTLAPFPCFESEWANSMILNVNSLTLSEQKNIDAKFISAAFWILTLYRKSQISWGSESLFLLKTIDKIYYIKMENKRIQQKCQEKRSSGYKR